MATMPGNAYTASFVLLIGALGTGCSYATVGPGQVGVVWTPSGTRPNAPDRARIAAQSKADTDKIEAEGHAAAKRIEAQATADYERLIELHLTDPMLRWQEIEALRTLGTSNNAKVIFVGGNHASGTLFELK